MTLHSRHMIRKSNPGCLRPSSLPLGHRGSHNSKYLRVSGKETHRLFETWISERGSNPRSPTFQACSFSHCTRAPASHFESKIFEMVVDPKHIGFQMKQKELNKIFMMVSNWKNPLFSMVNIKIFQCSNGYTEYKSTQYSWAFIICQFCHPEPVIHAVIKWLLRHTRFPGERSGL